MNSIDAHKDELERLLDELVGRHSVSETTFVTLLDVYIGRVDTNCSDIGALIDPPPIANQRRINMEPTLTQNCALYYVQHTTLGTSGCTLSKFSQGGPQGTPDHSMAIARYGTRFGVYHRTGSMAIEHT